MASYIIATIKSWNIQKAKELAFAFPEHEFVLITNPGELDVHFLEKFQPQFIFFPHWSWIIPAGIYTAYDCVVFHMTDLPFGRGGSPLQNLLSRGIYDNKISAIKVSKGIDTGPIYFKEELDIREGNADDIYRKVSEIVFHRMIPRLIQDAPVPIPQEGEPVTFPRRTPQQSEIPNGLSQRQLYDYIRMLDGEGYPAAFQRTGDRKIYYQNARLIDDVLYADAKFKVEG